MNKPDELEKNNQLRQNALAPVVAELIEINRQMSELNKEMIHQSTIMIEMLMKIKNPERNDEAMRQFRTMNPR